MEWSKPPPPLLPQRYKPPLHELSVERPEVVHIPPLLPHTLDGFKHGIPTTNSSRRRVNHHHAHAWLASDGV